MNDALECFGKSHAGCCWSQYPSTWHNNCERRLIINNWDKRNVCSLPLPPLLLLRHTGNDDSVYPTEHSTRQAFESCRTLILKDNLSQQLSVKEVMRTLERTALTVWWSQILHGYWVHLWFRFDNPVSPTMKFGEGGIITGHQRR